MTPTHLLSASGSSSIKVHDSNSEVPAQTLEKAHALGCHHVCASKDGKVAASAGFGGEVKLWVSDGDGEAAWVEKGSILEPAKAGEQWALALNENGQYLACTTHDGRINVYDTATISDSTASKIARFETKGVFALCVDLSPDSPCTMTASGHQNGTIFIFSNTTQRLVHALTGLIKPVRSVKFSPACKYLAAAGDARIIALYDTQSGEQVANLTGHASWVMSLDWNWSGEYLLSGCYDGKAKVWSLERRECVATQTESDKCLWAVKWLPLVKGARSEMFVTAGAGKTLSFYREATGS